MRGLVKGFGINDVEGRKSIKEDYYVNGKRKMRTLWVCPFYTKWLSIMSRSNCKSYKLTKPTYTEVVCSEEWRYFSKFKSWMESQQWEGLELDKDILVKGNKIYGPDTCVFVPRYINMCINSHRTGDSGLPIGVSRKSKDRQMINPHNNPYIARIAKAVEGGNINLGCFDTSKGAHKAWQEAKIVNLENVLNKYSRDTCFNSRVAEAIMQRIWQLKLDIVNNKETKSL